jgi:hypothetical protein
MIRRRICQYALTAVISAALGMSLGVSVGAPPPAHFTPSVARVTGH